MTKIIVATALAGLALACAWIYHAPALFSDGAAVQQARQTTEIERLRLEQRRLILRQIKEERETLVTAARLRKEQLAAQTQARIDNAPEVVAARIHSAVMAASWPFYAMFTAGAAAFSVLTYAAIRRVPFRHDGLETFVSRRHAACLAAQSIYLQGMSEQVRAQAFADETLRDRVTAGVNVFSALARTARAATHAALPAEQAALPAPESQAASVTFERARHDFRTGDMLLGYDATGAAIYLPLTSFVSCAFGGGSGSGKTSKLRFLVAQLLLQGVKVSILDAHAGNEQSLVDSLGALTRLPNCRVFPAFETAQAVQTMLSDVQAAIDAGTPQAVPSVYVLDELRPLNRACGDVETLMDKLANEGRKFGAYGVFSSQTWEAKMFDRSGSAARDACVLKIAAKMPKEQARTLFKDGETARTVARLRQAEMFADSAQFSGVVTVPFCSRQDLNAMAHSAGVAPVAAETTQPASLSVDTDNTDHATHANVGGDVIDLAARREQRGNATPTVTSAKQPDTGALPVFPQDALAAQLREYLQAQNMSLSKFADAAGVNKGLLSVFLRGEKRLSEAMTEKVTAAMRGETAE